MEAHVTERPTVQGEFMGHTIVSMGPPSSGGLIVISLLQTYERLRALHPDANRYHLWVEASRLSFFDRARAYGDPDFVHFDAARFASGAYADEQARRIGATATIDLPATVAQAVEGDHTTHISVVDKNGLAVAMTLTLPDGTKRACIVVQIVGPVTCLQRRHGLNRPRRLQLTPS